MLFHLFQQVLPMVDASCCPCFLSFVSSKEKTEKAVHFVGFAAANDPVMHSTPVGSKSPFRIWLNIWSFWTELLYFKSFWKGYLSWISSSKARRTIHFTIRLVHTENLMRISIALDFCVLLKRGQIDVCPNCNAWFFLSTKNVNYGSSVTLRWGERRSPQFWRASKKVCGITMRRMK